MDKENMSKIMEKPDWIENTPWFRTPPTISYYTGLKVKDMFYNQCLVGSMRINYIPDELEKIKWEPEDNKTYKCWWYYTNPADPADPGEDILVYIEEFEDTEVKGMRGEIVGNINQLISKLNLEQLRDLENYLNNLG